MNQRRADFDRFVADSTDTLLRTAYLIVWDLGEAEDLVQETLLDVARRWPRVRRMEHPVAYARRILVNRALGGASRRARRRQELTAAAPPERPADPSDPGAVDVHAELMSAMAELLPRQRAVLVLRYFLDLPEAEVAAAMKCSLGTVKSTASRGLARLEQAMRPSNQTRSIPTAMCINGPSFMSVSESGGNAPVNVTAGRVLLSSVHRSDRGNQVYGWASGRTGDGVTLVLDDGTKVQATVANGWFVGWWPSGRKLDSAELTTPGGVSTQTFNLQWPQPGAGKGGETGSFSGGGTGTGFSVDGFGSSH